MASDDKLQRISLTIQKLIEEKKKKNDASAQDDQLILSDLLSQLESLKGDELPKQSGGVAEPDQEISAVGEAETKGENADKVDGGGAEIGREEIAKELRKLQRQNFMTQCLLAFTIVLTVAWQLSEVKLILYLKDGVTHPFRFVGSLLMGMLRRPRKYVEKKYVENKNQIEALLLPSLRVPELPYIPDLPRMDLSELLDSDTLNQLNHHYSAWKESKNNGT